MSVPNIEHIPAPSQQPNVNVNGDLTPSTQYTNDRSPASLSTASMSPFLLSGSPEENYLSDMPMFGNMPQPLLGQQQQQLPRKSTHKSVSAFINKLFSMVSEERHQHLISWNATGLSFFIYNAKQFAKDVLPAYFKHGNFSSFVRQLNMYGFRKINKSSRGQHASQNELWEFSHPKFIRDQPRLLKDIHRKAMDSEMLQRETGEMQASFSVMQNTQNELVHQLHVLQQNFSQLQQGFEYLKKIQYQQQAVIQKLIERSHNVKDNQWTPPNVQDGNLTQNAPLEAEKANAPSFTGTRPAAILKNMPPTMDKPSYAPNNFQNASPEVYLSDFSSGLDGVPQGLTLDTPQPPPSPMNSVFWGSPASQSYLSGEELANFSMDEDVDFDNDAQTEQYASDPFPLGF